MPGDKMTSEQTRCAFLAFRCEHGFDRRDKEKKKPIPEEKALQEWEELLNKRFPQSSSGGISFVLKIMRIVKIRRLMRDLTFLTKLLSSSAWQSGAKTCARYIRLILALS